MSNLFVTDVGRAVARSGLLPTTAAYFLDYFRSNIAQFAQFIEGVPGTGGGEGDSVALEQINADLAFIFFHMCYSSPELATATFQQGGFCPTRWMRGMRARERAVCSVTYL